ncbi:hypothetical protein [Bacillus toyonensis]|uniref:hypothetical protein n=1 Tax=Bacillus toyonensis TaxID=155322 RepID=UPI002E232956|nr:hypothetical protein [Bacillus toyonensis]
MRIDKLEKGLFETLEHSLRNYINAWHKIPGDMDVNDLNISRVRYVKEWGLKTAPEDGFIIEFSTDSDSYRELLGRSELSLTTKEFKTIIQEQNENGLLFGKDVTTKQMWYEYPVIWGTLDNIFDDEYYYENDGKYASNEYANFGMKYD